MNLDPLLGRTIVFDPSELTKDGDEMSDFEKLVDEQNFDCLADDSEHTRWQSQVKDRPLRQSARSTETAVTANVSIFSTCSSFFRRRWSDPPKSPIDPSTPPRKPIRTKSRTNLTIARPQRLARTPSFESDKNCPRLRKSLSCSRISLLKA